MTDKAQRPELEQKTESPEQPEYLNRRDIIRAFVESYALSQGNEPLHECLIAWLSSRYGNERTLEALRSTKGEDVQNAAVAEANARMGFQKRSDIPPFEQGLNHPVQGRRTLQESAEKEWGVFRRYFFSVDELPEPEQYEALTKLRVGMDDIAFTLIGKFYSRDARFTHNQNGRPRQEEGEKWRKFLIDFLILKRDEGKYPYSRFSRLWEPMFELMRQELLHPKEHADAVNLTLIAAVRAWKAKGPHSAGDIEKVDAFLKVAHLTDTAG